MDKCCFCKKPAYAVYWERPMCGECIDALEAPRMYTDDALKSFALGESSPTTDIETLRMFRAFLERNKRPS